jgi:hypothetical protein
LTALISVLSAKSLCDTLELWIRLQWRFFGFECDLWQFDGKNKHLPASSKQTVNVGKTPKTPRLESLTRWGNIPPCTIFEEKAASNFILGVRRKT